MDLSRGLDNERMLIVFFLVIKNCRHLQNSNWNEIAKEIFFRTHGQSFKSSKQCRQRWQNHLDNRIRRKKSWQVSEDLIILQFVLENGKRWSKIVEKLQNTRTQHMVKNRFKSLLAKSEVKLVSEKNGENEKEVQMIQTMIKGLRQKMLAMQQQQQISPQSHEQKQQRKQKRQKQQPTHQSLEIQSQIISKEEIVININSQQKQQQQQLSKVNIQKRCHGMILIGQSGEFEVNNNDEQFVRLSQQRETQQQQQVFNIFECQSPATLSLASSGFLLSSSYSSFTPQSTCNIFTNNNNYNNLTFSSFQQRWQRNRVQQKGSINSDVGSNRTSKLIQCSRKQDNLLFSLQYNNLLNNNNNNNHDNKIDFISNQVCNINNNINNDKINNNNKNNNILFTSSSLSSQSTTKQTKHSLQTSEYFLSQLQKSLVLMRQKQQFDVKDNIQ